MVETMSSVRTAPLKVMYARGIVLFAVRCSPSVSARELQTLGRGHCAADTWKPCTRSPANGCRSKQRTVSHEGLGETIVKGPSGQRVQVVFSGTLNVPWD